MLTASIDSVTGTSGNDTINATVGVGTAATTLGAADNIVGGSGDDTLSILVEQDGSVDGVEAVAQVLTIEGIDPATDNNTVVLHYGSLSQTLVLGTDAAESAAAIAAGINALAGRVIAEVDAGVVTITAPVAGTPLPTIAFDTYEEIADALTIVEDTENVVGVEAVDLTTAVTAAAALVSGVEVINVRNIGGAFTIDGANITGETEYVSDRSTGANTFSNIGTADITIKGNDSVTNGAVNFSSSATASVTDALVINVKDGVNAGVVTSTSANDDWTSVTINSTGGTATSTTNANVLTSMDVGGGDQVGLVTINATSSLTTGTISGWNDSAAANLTNKIVVNGTAAVNVGTVDTNVKFVDASAASGALTMSIGDQTDLVVTGGSGNDVITASTTASIASTQTLAVDAGEGTGDVLVITNTTDVDSAADGARYSNFEVIRTAVDQNVGLVAGITAVQLNANNGITISGVNGQTFTARGDIANDLTVELADNGVGTADALTLNLASTTATSNVDVAGIALANIETLYVNATTGAAAAKSDIAFGSGTDDLTSLVIAGTQNVGVTTTNLDEIITIDASGLTGTGALTITGATTAGSTVIGSDQADTVTVSSTLGTTYRTGAGNDSVTAAVATLVADGEDDTVIDAGAGTTDTLKISDNGSTLTDNHFTNVTGFEKLTYDDGGALSLTAGGAFSTAFADGVTITASTDDAAAVTMALGLYNKATVVNLTSAGLGNSTGENLSITTGDAADRVTVTASSWVGVAGATSAIILATDAGDDYISLSGYDLAANTTTVAIQIDAGTGADTIVLSGDNGAGATAYAKFTVAAGDSLVTAYDSITGFEKGDGTNYASVLDFTGTSAVSDFTSSTDAGVIKSHSITAGGIVSFDDAANYAAALVINASNLADVIAYLQANTDNLDTVAFAYDSDSSGSADATMVFNNNTTDSLVLLVGLTGVTALGSTATTAHLVGIA